MKGRAGRRGAADIALLMMSLVILGILLGFGGYELRATLPGFYVDPYTWLVEAVETSCGEDPACVRAGDRVLRLGELDRETFRSNRDVYLFRDLPTATGEDFEVVVERDGPSGKEVLELRVPSEHWHPTEALYVFLQGLFPLIFWIVGTVTILFLRPHDERWKVLVALCYTTAIWAAAGYASGKQYGIAPEVFHFAVWLFPPLFVHLHLVMPRPSFPRLRRWLLPLIYGGAAIAIVLDPILLLSRDVIAYVILGAILVSLLLIAYRLGWSRDKVERMATRLLLFGVGLGVLPVVFLVVVLTFVPVGGHFEVFSNLAGILFLCILPLWPLSYLYALYKHGPSGVEFRANRLLGAYGFFAFYISTFISVFVVGYERFVDAESRAAYSLLLSLVFVVIAPMLRRRFQLLVDRTIYGVKYQPEDVLALFAHGIPTAMQRDRMREVVERDILPTLMIRRSALFLLAPDRPEAVEIVYRQEVEGVPSAEELRELIAATRPYVNLEMGANPRFPWLRLLVPLRAARGEEIGVWMLGRRDPDDYYPRSDIDLIVNLANQLAPVVENARLVQRARQEVEENRRLQAQLVQAQKMEAIGRLSAGVAHDFNNLLSVILGYSSMLLARYRDDETLIRYLGDIKDAGNRAASLTRQLLTFSRQQVMEPRVVGLNSVIVDVEKMLRRLTGEDVMVSTELEPSLPPVKVDPGQMGQVLMNLTVNARDAMPDGGQLRIRTSSVELDEALEDPQQGRLAPGRYVLLEVDDDGVGIPSDIVPRIFEPYFTTKDRGKGTGLGLAMVYGIINQSRGFIQVDVKEGRSGTRFCIFLPVSETDEDSGAVEAPRRPSSASGDETVLVVEDEDSVRKVASEILRSSGYRVLEASNGPDALSLAADASVIDLLLTDVIMPQMKGTELARRLTEQRPEVKVVFMSGYNEESILGRRLGEAGTVLVPKPFAPEDLARTVRDVLDG